MVTVEICIGSACYVKGSSQLIDVVKQLLEEKGWQDQVELKGCFCIKSCQYHLGLGVRIDGRLVENVTLANCRTLVEKELQEVLA
ncbi:MAG: (2Fe-2S) ferredoxin domain-containing protein [Bulleidia sp.]